MDDIQNEEAAKDTERRYRASLSKASAVHDMWSLSDFIDGVIGSIDSEVKHVSNADLGLLLEVFGETVERFVPMIRNAVERVQKLERESEESDDKLDYNAADISLTHAKALLDAFVWLASDGRKSLLDIERRSSEH